MLSIEHFYWVLAAFLAYAGWRNLRQRRYAHAAFWTLIGVLFAGGDAVLRASKAVVTAMISAPTSSTIFLASMTKLAFLKWAACPQGPNHHANWLRYRSPSNQRAAIDMATP